MYVLISHSVQNINLENVQEMIYLNMSMIKANYLIYLEQIMRDYIIRTIKYHFQQLFG